jgi:hypothetical protein
MLINESMVDGMVLLRRSLWENGQYIYYPSNWMSSGPSVYTLPDEELNIINKNIWKGNIIYNKGLHKVWYQ